MLRRAKHISLKNSDSSSCSPIMWVIRTFMFTVTTQATKTEIRRLIELKIPRKNARFLVKHKI